jgi:hypothetical protein
MQSRAKIWRSHVSVESFQVRFQTPRLFLQRDANHSIAERAGVWIVTSAASFLQVYIYLGGVFFAHYHVYC